METRAWMAVIEMPRYTARATKIMSIEEQEAVIEMVAKNPETGDVMPGTGGVRKVRVPLAGRGKSGGARVVYYFHNESIPLYLLDVFAKNEKDNLSMAERNAMKKVVVTIVGSHQKGR